MKKAKKADAAALGFIGAGNMAQAIAGGLLRAKLFTPEQIIVSAPTDKNLAAFKDWGCATTHDNAEVLRQSDTVVIACKPHFFPQVAPQIAANLRPGSCLISVMAGLDFARLQQATAPLQAAWLRAMPNTPLAIGLGATALCPGPGANANHLAQARALFACAGEVFELQEAQLDAFTAVAGSGPAYVFLLAEALEKSAIGLGLNPTQARAAVAQMLLGSAHLLAHPTAQTPLPDPARLRLAVTSPKGCTAEAIRVMEEAQLPAIVARALQANVERSQKLRQESANDR